MRITGGRFKGRRLASPPGLKTRPTPAKVREAVFNICRDFTAGATVADLFAGTGAMGIEALSRGAKYAVFVESDRRAAGIIKKNLETCGASDRAAVLCRDLLGGPSAVSEAKAVFDLVFMDPPYARGSLVMALEKLSESGTLAPGALIAAEHCESEQIPPGHAGLEVIDCRRYGKTLVSFMSYMIPE